MGVEKIIISRDPASSTITHGIPTYRARFTRSCMHPSIPCKDASML